MKMRIIPCLFMLSIVLVSISYPVTGASAKKVIIENITLNVTVIVPITIVAQNVQLCVSLASSGDQTCQQVILDPTQATYTPVDVDLTEGQPIITSGSANQTSTTTATPSNETSSSAGNSNQTFAPGNSNITNPTNDHDSNNTHDQTANPTASDNHNAKDDKNTKDSKDQKQDESTQEEPAQDDSTGNGDADQP